MSRDAFSAAVDAAQDAFWAAVVRHYPQVHGDLPWDVQERFDAASREVVQVWLETSNPQV